MEGLYSEGLKIKQVCMCCPARKGIRPARTGDSLLVIQKKENSGSLVAYQEPHMDIGEFLPLAIRITAALTEYHLRGVPHGNLIPPNILIPLEKSSIVLIDQLSDSKRPRTNGAYRTLSGSATPLAYMSPEQIRRLN